MDCSGMNLAMVSRALEGKMSLYKGVRGIKVSSDVTSWCFATVLLDAKWDVGGASIMLEARQYQRYRSPSWSMCQHLLRVRGVSIIRYLLGSTTLALTSVLTSPTSYTQPFGSDGRGNAESFGNDLGELPTVVVGLRNLNGILTVLLKAVDEASCQRCGLRMTEVKSHHAIGRNGS
jgi:hypothetical protein